MDGVGRRHVGRKRVGDRRDREKSEGRKWKVEETGRRVRGRGRIG